MTTNLEEKARELAEWLHHLLCAAQNLPWEEGDCCEDCEANVKEGALPILTQVQAEARLAALEEAAKLAIAVFSDTVDIAGRSAAAVIAKRIRLAAQAAAPAKETK